MQSRPALHPAVKRGGDEMTPRKWTPEQNAQIIKLWAEGLRARQIAPIIGIGYDPTRAHCRRLGLIPPSDNPNKRPKSSLPVTVMPCLRCGNPFNSVDRRANRICVECKQHGCFSHTMAESYEVHS